MTCEDCVMATNDIKKVAYYRIGTKELGYGNIGLVGCDKHIVLALDRLNLWGEGRTNT